MPREIVYVADDLGLSDRVNEAIIHAHRCGVLDGASLMLGQPATEAAVALAKEHPSLQIGWHLHLVDSQPCTRPRWPWGDSPAGAGFAIGFSSRMRGLVRAELQHQWQAFLDTGLPCCFVNSHHHIHIHPFVRKTVLETLPTEFTGWVRWGRPRFFGRTPLRVGYHTLDTFLQAPYRRRLPFATSTTLWGVDRTFNMQQAEISAVLPSLGDGLHEFMFHPRRMDADPDTSCLVALKEA